jgi:hypothetical protein
MASVTRSSRRYVASMITVNGSARLGALRAQTCSLSSRGRRHLVAGMGVITHRRMIGMDAVAHGCMIDGMWRRRCSRPRVLGVRLGCRPLILHAIVLGTHGDRLDIHAVLQPS